MPKMELNFVKIFKEVAFEPLFGRRIKFLDIQQKMVKKEKGRGKRVKKKKISWKKVGVKKK